ncbi:MAG TPA: hypothetical protein EYP23_03140 [Thermoplasmata archaeon]|nr:hypothetical protein [Thermoplasmata archaeon]
MRIEIEHRSPKEQVEKNKKNIKKNLEVSDTLYIVTSDELAKRKVVQVALRVLFHLRKEKPDKDFKIMMGTVNEEKKNGFREWFELKSI